MATVGKRKVLMNTGHKHRAKPKRKLSDKQVKFFGTPGQKRALARRRAEARGAGKAAAQRKQAAASKKRKTGSSGRPSHQAASKQKNAGGIVSFTLNSGKKGTNTSMAAKKSKSKGTSAAKRSGGGRGAAKKGRSRRGNPRRNFTGLATNALLVVAGAVGSRISTQALLGTRNMGFIGYIGNAGAGFGLSLLARWALRSADAANSILLGTAVGIVLRLIGEFTPFGEYARQAGLGDYQISNFVTPQRLADPLNSAEVEIPPGWAPRIAPPAANAGPAGVAGYGNGLYSSSGLYS